jgi:hypothetical protein
MHLNTLFNYGKFVCLIISLMKVLYVGCSLLLLQVDSRVGVRLC